MEAIQEGLPARLGQYRLLRPIGAGGAALLYLAVARRIARGPRARDSLVVAVSMPWALARSVTETTLLAPFLLGAAAASDAAAKVAHHGAHVPARPPSRPCTPS